MPARIPRDASTRHIFPRHVSLRISSSTSDFDTLKIGLHSIMWDLFVETIPVDRIRYVIFDLNIKDSHDARLLRCVDIPEEPVFVFSNLAKRFREARNEKGMILVKGPNVLVSKLIVGFTPPECRLHTDRIASEKKDKTL
jgi:hypothetical protein